MGYSMEIEDRYKDEKYRIMIDVINNFVSDAIMDSLQNNKRAADIRYDCVLSIRNQINIYLDSINSLDNSEKDH